MAFGFVRGLWQKKSAPNQTVEELEVGRVTVVEPAELSFASAEKRFYAAVFELAEEEVSSTRESLSLPEKLILDVVRSEMSEREFRTKSVPRLPSVIPKLVRSLRDPDTSAKDYVNIINKDPTMSAAVLKLANSAYFNPTSNPIGAIETAVVKLGIEGLRAVLSAAVMQPVIQQRSDYYSQFGHKLWDHTLCCAVTCEIIARARGLEPFKGYLLGLSHDIGKISLFSEMCRQFRLNTSGSKPRPSAFIPLLEEKSASLSAAIALDWGLPKEICEALMQQVELEMGRQVSQYAEVLYHANVLCNAYAIVKAEAGEPSVDLHRLATQVRVSPDIYSQLRSLAVQVQ